MNKKISVVIIAKNEEEILEGCLKSVLWTDEIILVDDNSIDKTRDIAKVYHAKIFHHKWLGFSQQKNFGILQATGDWILSLDADERISLDLQKEIKKVLNNPSSKDAYALNRYNVFLGKLMRHGGWYPDEPIRLFKKGKAQFDVSLPIHEVIKIQGSIGKLSSPLYHLSHRNIASDLEKTLLYSKIQSNYLYTQNAAPISIFHLSSRMLIHFFNRFIRAKGYKDGMEGFIEATYQTFSQIFIIQSMLWEKQRDKSTQELYREIDKAIEENLYEK